MVRRSRLWPSDSTPLLEITSRAAAGQFWPLTDMLATEILFTYLVQEPVIRPELYQLPVAVLSSAARFGSSQSCELRFNHTPKLSTTLLRTVT